MKDEGGKSKGRSQNSKTCRYNAAAQRMFGYGLWAIGDLLEKPIVNNH